LFGGSSGRDVLVAGTGASTVIGAGSGITIVGHGTAGDNLVAGSGNETLVGSGDGGNDIMFAGSGADAMFAGTGNDTFAAASGGAQMVAGPGKDLFIFSNGAAASANSIFNFTQGQDHVAMFGYGPNAVADALAHDIVEAGSTSIMLSDNTQITFANVANLKSTDFL
jgi:Ca2+-binding RTX toxin-like protein